MCSDLKISVEVGAGLPKLIARSRTQSESWSVPLSSQDQIDQIMRLLATARDYLPKRVDGHADKHDDLNRRWVCCLEMASGKRPEGDGDAY